MTRGERGPRGDTHRARIVALRAPSACASAECAPPARRTAALPLPGGPSVPDPGPEPAPAPAALASRRPSGPTRLRGVRDPARGSSCPCPCPCPCSCPRRPADPPRRGPEGIWTEVPRPAPAPGPGPGPDTPPPNPAPSAAATLDRPCPLPGPAPALPPPACAGILPPRVLACGEPGTSAGAGGARGGADISSIALGMRSGGMCG